MPNVLVIDNKNQSMLFRQFVSNHINLNDVLKIVQAESTVLLRKHISCHKITVHKLYRILSITRRGKIVEEVDVEFIGVELECGGKPTIMAEEVEEYD